MKTKAEVRAFLDTLVGKVVVNKPDPQYNGQCVTLIKAVLEVLGVQDPYRGRGNAIDVGDALVRQGIAQPGKGQVTVVVNKDMGRIYEPSLGRYVNYGHIWIDIAGEANYESNGNRALYTTKNTRPITQGQQFVNLDQWIGDNMSNPVNGDVDNILGEIWGRKPNPEDYGYTKQNWHDFIYNILGAYPWKDRMADYRDAVQKRKDLEIVSAIAETRSRNLQAVCDGVGVIRQPDEQATSQAIVDKFNASVQARTTAEGNLVLAQGRNTELEARIKALESGDKIVITKEGWTGLFDVIKQFFSKKK